MSDGKADFDSWFFRRKPFLLLILFLFLGLAAAYALLERFHSEEIIENFRGEMEAYALLASRMVLENQKAAIKILESSARFHPLVEAAKKRSVDRAEIIMKNLLEGNREFYGLFLTDPEGTLWANVPVNRQTHGQKFSYRDWYGGVSREWRPYVSRVFRRVVEDRALAVAVCVPIFDEKGKVVGILGASQTLPFLKDWMKDMAFGPGKNISVLDPDGNIIFSSTLSHEKEITPHPWHRILNEKYGGKKGAHRIGGSSGGENAKHIAFFPVDSSGWSVVLEAEEREILRAHQAHFYQSGAVFFLIFCAVSLGLFYLRKEMIFRKTYALLKVERNLAESERRYRSMLENVRMLAVGLDREGRITYANPFLLESTGYSFEEVKGKDWFDTFLSGKVKEEMREVFSGILQGGNPLHYENPIRTKSGEERLITWNNSLLKDTKGRVLGTMSLGEDVTDHKLAEERLLTSLREKEVLLKEIHHRVKNNLQVISSLLNLESRRMQDAQAVEALRETQNRVRSMALAHERLYRSTDLARVDFGEYIRSVAASLFSSYHALAQGVSYEVNVEDTLLGVDIAIPCGLILTELVSNSLKHAFPDGRKGRIFISFRSGGDERYVLRVKDNGIGFPPGMDIGRIETLGLQLADTLARQLAGSLELSRDGGTEINLTFGDGDSAGGKHG